MWYLNYCAPFVDDDATINAVRYALIGDLLLLFLGYIGMRIFYVCSSTCISMQHRKQLARKPLTPKLIRIASTD